MGHNDWAVAAVAAGHSPAIPTNKPTLMAVLAESQRQSADLFSWQNRSVAGEAMGQLGPSLDRRRTEGELQVNLSESV